MTESVNASGRGHREAIERIAEENREYYATDRGRRMLRAFELPFEHRWIYIFELVQNALDARAKSIAIDLADQGDGLVVQHDGTEPLEERHVAGLSEIFRSTKGASSVGFMGIGFKSVFGRFRRAEISGWGWKFRYEIPQEEGRYGEILPDLLGAVVPVWDEGIAEPEVGFSTRFGLRGRFAPDADISSDLAHFLSPKDRTPLAILANMGLERLSLAGETWRLEVAPDTEGSRRATALSPGESWSWQLFPVEFQPSREAIARFLEHRRIRPSSGDAERVYEEASRPREILGVVPLGPEGRAAPPGRGRVFATLPTEISLPFGLHVNADWLLNMPRTGLREIEENAWQREIATRITDVLGAFLRWVAETSRDPEDAGAAFRALACPDPESAERLETLLAEEGWLERLGSTLRESRVLPTWARDGAAELTFARPGEAVFPPVPLAEAFEQEPELLPGPLLGAPVVAREVLGEGAEALLAAAGLVDELTPPELEAAWRNGLEPWWQRLPGPSARRRDLLFRVWGALGEFFTDDEWQSAVLACLRSQRGDWIPIQEAAYLNEALPSRHEPGGEASRGLIEDFLPDGARCLPDDWMPALRQRAGNEEGIGPFEHARDWIEEHAEPIDLAGAIADAIEARISSGGSDWSDLVALGHWIMHRRSRPDLLTYVLADTPNGESPVLVEDALVADPYVERGEGRRRLFPWLSPISGSYLDNDPNEADAHTWRRLFENAGGQGALGFRKEEQRVGRYETATVAEFLGVEERDVPDSTQGYRLREFRIEPPLPEPEAGILVRRAVAPWLEDGYSAFIGKGRRVAEYFYYAGDRKLGKSCDWVHELKRLAWVPCDDGELRRPTEVLAEPDPAREDSPIAELSEELVRVLEAEGVQFGADIPQAPALRRLLRVGSELDDSDLAALLRELREAGGEQSQYAEAVEGIRIPGPDGRRVPLRRVVRKAGGGQRSLLGGWIVPLSELSEELRSELEHPAFPFDFPITTTGYQALEYIHHVWGVARSEPERLANEVRDTLPLAYAYCLEDAESDEGLAKRWEEGLSSAAVFADREWFFPGDRGADVFFDDFEDRRFLPRGTDVPVATSGHLGNELRQQKSTARALGLRFLSSIVEPEWSEYLPAERPDWEERFDLMCRMLDAVRGGEGDGVGLRLRPVDRLELTIRAADRKEERVPVDARLSDGTLTVAGSPVGFSADAANEVVREFSFRQRHGVATCVAGLFAAIDDEREFTRAARKLLRAFVRDTDLAKELEAKLAREPGGGAHPIGAREADEPKQDREPRSEAHRAGRPGSGDSRGRPSPPAKVEGSKPSGSGGGSYTLGRAVAPVRVLEQRKAEIEEAIARARKGELRPEELDSLAEAPVSSEEEPGEPGATAADGELGDELFRKAAAAYERVCGREPAMGDSRQVGWDLSSRDPATGGTRLIEVKGRRHEWNEDEVVELSGAQVRNAMEVRGQGDGVTWWLYVVELLPDGAFEVLPLENPVRHAAKWMLRGAGWRSAATESKRIDPDDVETESGG